MATSPHAAAQTQMAFRLSWSPTCLRADTHRQAGQSTPSVQRHSVPVCLLACVQRTGRRAARRQASLGQAGGYFNRWSQQGIFQKIQQALHRRERRSQGRKPTASAGSIDSQSIKTATQGKIKGYDSSKKINPVPTADRYIAMIHLLIKRLASKSEF